MNFLLYLTGISKLCFHLAYKFLGTGRKDGVFLVSICIQVLRLEAKVPVLRVSEKHIAVLKLEIL